MENSIRYIIDVIVVWHCNNNNNNNNHLTEYTFSYNIDHDENDHHRDMKAFLYH